MAAGQTIPTTPIYGAKILTVDPSTGVVQGVMKGDNQSRAISVYTTPIAFRWPMVGESWMLQQINGTWYLDSPWPASNATTSFQSVNPGDVILNTPTGVVHVIGSTTDTPMDYSLNPPTAWAGTPYATNWGDAGAPWQPAQYSINPLGECLIRGVVAKSIAWVEGETIATLPEGFWPAAQELFACPAKDSAGITLQATVAVSTIGQLVLYSVAPAVWSGTHLAILSLAGIRFATP